MAQSYEEVAKQFVEFYYNTFDTNRAGLSSLYRENSMLTFESSSVLGIGPITDKLSHLPFQKVKHQVATSDAQPSLNNGILILITGHLMVDDEQNPIKFSQTFQLMQDPTGSYFVYNDIFKLVFG